MAQAGKLSEQAVVAAAIAQLHEGGLDSVSLRNVAKRLNARAPSLARHVGDKGRLLTLMAQHIFGEALDAIPAGLKGADWLTAFGHALRAKQAATRDVAALIAQAPANPEIDHQTGERLASLLEEAGLAGPEAKALQRAIQALVTGWMVFEKSPRRITAFGSADGRDAAFAESLAALITGFSAAR